MKLKGMKLLFVYLSLIAVMFCSALQLSEKTATAQEGGGDGMVLESGTCCSYSTDCPGAQICFLPDKRAGCCDVRAPSCAGANYCQSQ